MKSTFSRRFSKHLILCAAILLSVGMKASAENYVGIQGGLTFGGKVSNVKGDINPNYQNSLIVPGFLPPPIAQNIRDARITGADLNDAKLDESLVIGAKVGHYFDSLPFLGIEGEVNFSKPDLKQQVFTSTNENSTTLGVVNGTTSKVQRAADIYDIYGGASLMLRYPAFKRVEPYFGAGPMIHYFRVRGTGTAPVNTDAVIEAFGGPITPRVDVSGPGIKEDKISLGVQAKAGLRLNVTKHLSADVEYKYNFAPARLDNFRDLDNYRGNFGSHQVGLALVYRFGNIKW